ncbi:MAG: hypothetical protein WBA43_02035 [Elainellaceae cyanobacterium]
MSSVLPSFTEKLGAAIRILAEARSWRTSRLEASHPIPGGDRCHSFGQRNTQEVTNITFPLPRV